jgi:hypothetical protein
LESSAHSCCWEVRKADPVVVIRRMRENWGRAQASSSTVCEISRAGITRSLQGGSHCV